MPIQLIININISYISLYLYSTKLCAKTSNNRQHSPSFTTKLQTFPAQGQQIHTSRLSTWVYIFFLGLSSTTLWHTFRAHSLVSISINIHAITHHHLPHSHTVSIYGTSSYAHIWIYKRRTLIRTISRTISHIYIRMRRAISDYKISI